MRIRWRQSGIAHYLLVKAMIVRRDELGRKGQDVRVHGTASSIALRLPTKVLDVTRLRKRTSKFKYVPKRESVGGGFINRS